VATPNRAVPVKKTPPPQPASQGVDSTLALLAAIKENRAGLLRSEVTAKAAPQPEAPVPAPEPPAKVQQSKLPEPTPAPTRGPASSVAPAPLSISERIERHPAIPTSRNAIAAGAPLRGENVSRAAPPSSPVAAIDKIPGGRVTLLIVGAVIAVGGVATGLILRSHRTPAAPRVAGASTAPATPPAAANNFPLQLQVEPQGKQTNVRWNPQSTLIAQSREGRLVITENNQKPRTIPLALDQLKFGHLAYTPLTDRVEFRLEVVDSSGSVAEESVLSLATPPPVAQANAPAGAPATAQAAPAPAPKNGAPPVPNAAEAAKTNRPAARPFTPPAVNRALGPDGIVDAPPEVSATVTAPEAISSAQVPRAAAPPPPAPAASPRPLSVESNLQAAKLVKKVTPVYPPLARSARVQGTVHFKATIGKDGSVQNLEMVDGPSILRQPAIDAVKQWRYQPTVLNGQPMEVVTSIDVTFTLGQ
jgi:protein TonB